MVRSTSPATPSMIRRTSRIGRSPCVSSRMGIRSRTRTCPLRASKVVSRTHVPSRYRRLLVNGSRGRMKKQPPDTGSSSRAKIDGRIEIWQAQPVDRAVGRNERRCPTIADEAVVIDRRLCRFARCTHAKLTARRMPHRAAKRSGHHGLCTHRSRRCAVDRFPDRLEHAMVLSKWRTLALRENRQAVTRHRCCLARWA